MSLTLRMTLNIELTLNHVPWSHYEAPSKVYLRKQKGESLKHVLMKLMSYMIFYDPDLHIEISAQQHYKPDLARFDFQGQPIQWIDCGQTSFKKLDRISQRNKRTFIDIVKATPRELDAYAAQATTRLKRPARVRYWSFERANFITDLERHVFSRHAICATVTADFSHLYLLIDDRLELDTPLYFLGSRDTLYTSHDTSI